MLAATNVDRVLDELYKKLVGNMVKYRQQGSGRTLTRINYVDMTVYEYDPTRAGAAAGTTGGGDHAEIISRKLRDKRALVDVRTDEKDTCFKWSFIAARKRFKRDCAKEDLLPFEKEFDFESLEFPVDVYCDTYSKQHAFRKFEIANDTSVNIYTVKNRDDGSAETKKKKSVEKPTTTTVTSIGEKRKKNESPIVVVPKKKKKKKTNPFIIREAFDEDGGERGDDDDESVVDDENETMDDFIDDDDAVGGGEDPSFFININRTLNEKEEKEEEEEEEKEEEEEEEEGKERYDIVTR